MRLSSVLLCAAGCLLPSVLGAITTYNVILDGPSESPANGSPGTGVGTVTIDDAANTMQVQVTFTGLTGTTTACHIHGPTTNPLTLTAGVMTTTPTFAGFPSGVTSGSYDSGVLDLTQASSYNPTFVTNNGGTPTTAAVALISAIVQQKAYLNIHSSTFAGGEIRGFLIAASAVGDPQFVGFQGQSFQVHGIPDEYFNLVTSPDFQVNSRFVYLASGVCNYNHTECWSHPGTYIDRVGLMFPNGITLSLVAGPSSFGMRVWFGSNEIHPTKETITYDINNETLSVTFADQQHITIQYKDFTFTFVNSDWFFNFHSMFHRLDLLRLGKKIHHMSDDDMKQTSYPQVELHGLLGQTWKNIRYTNNKMYQGHIDDYMLQDHNLFSTQFTYNLFRA